MDPITYPLRAFAREHKLSPTYLYDLIAQGKIKSVLIKKRRHIYPGSYRKYIEQLGAEQDGAKLPSSNPNVKAREAALVATRTTEQQQSPTTRKNPRDRCGS